MEFNNSQRHYFTTGIYHILHLLFAIQFFLLKLPVLAKILPGNITSCILFLPCAFILSNQPKYLFSLLHMNQCTYDSVSLCRFKLASHRHSWRAMNSNFFVGKIFARSLAVSKQSGSCQYGNK
jgi:hypothetical protein